MTVETCTWHALCQIGDIPRQGARIVGRPGQTDIAVFRTQDDSVFAIEDRCPHKGGPLSAGLVHGNAVACPLHNWTIDLASGEAVAPDSGCVRRYDVRLEGQQIWLALDTAPQG
jgi:nitrite reductase (NADH) small subunit